MRVPSATSPPVAAGAEVPDGGIELERVCRHYEVGGRVVKAVDEIDLRIEPGAFVPINFAVVRMAQSYVHPRTLGTTTGGMPGEMMLTFLIDDGRHRDNRAWICSTHQSDLLFEMTQHNSLDGDRCCCNSICTK